jgi:hypothetical protein
MRISGAKIVIYPAVPRMGTAGFFLCAIRHFSGKACRLLLASLKTFENQPFT